MSDTRLIAFYLPQFHPIPENDSWWGKGFTEWSNVANAKPVFPGHYQPHLPADLGFYDLRLAEVREEQARLAKEHGIYGFCYYYYYFNGKRLLNTPLDENLKSGKPDFPFCVCWANENWTRKWDGFEDDILIEQVHSQADDARFIRQLLPVLKDKRYIRINNKLLLLVYRTELLPDPKNTAETWRKIVQKELEEELYLCTVNNFVKDLDPSHIGFDGVVQFPLDFTIDCQLDKSLIAKLFDLGLNEVQNNWFFDYPCIVDHMVSQKAPPYTLFRGVFPSWDNTARRQNSSTIFLNSSPDLYKLFLKATIGLTETEHKGDERLVFINAWNEWAEGTHLEPDKKYGLRFLEATKEAMAEKNNQVLLMEDIRGRADGSINFYKMAQRLQDKLVIAEGRGNDLTLILEDHKKQFSEDFAKLQGLIAQKDTRLQEKEQHMEFLEMAKKESESILQQKDQFIRKIEGIAAEKENKIQSQEYIIKENENLIGQRDDALQERDLIILDRDNELMARNDTINVLNHELREKGETILSQNLTMQEKINAILTLELTLKEMEEASSILNNQLKEKNEAISILNDDLNAKNSELKFEIRLLEEHHKRINDLLSSMSWQVTKPLRYLHPKALKLFYVFFPYGSKSWSVVKRMVQQFSGTLPQPVTPGPLSDSMETTGGKAENLPPETESQPSHPVFNGQSSILFIGHDALLAGAQVLQLTLLRWLKTHTSINIKIILLRGGILLDKFNEIAPTLIWEDLMNQHPDPLKRNASLSDFIGKVSLVYGNTVVTPVIYDELGFLGVPYITHVHELEKSIKLYISSGTIRLMLHFTNTFVACSEPVGMNLITNHHVARENITTIHEFIEVRNIQFNKSKKQLRKELGLVEDGIIVIGCGTIYWRKGVDLFFETAIKLKDKGFSNFHFYWIGENIWDIDQHSASVCSWNQLEQKALENGLQDKITFLGVKENVFQYLLLSDVFYLPSREDPFPLVCLEATQCGVPVICFADAGGMPDFIEDDAGFVVPYEDVDQVAEKIKYLSENQEILKSLGDRARQKFLERHTVDIAAPQVLNLCRKTSNLRPLVSVIVPNYNCAKFLKRRLDSILYQTFQDIEIILLDDASTDDSLTVIAEYLDHPYVNFHQNTENSGIPFIQWQKGFEMAKGDFIWFAEADDYCEPDFLEKLLPNFNKASVAIAYSNSLIVDEEDRVTGNYDSYLEALDPYHWKSSYVVDGSQEIMFGLGVKNSIPNASAVLIRKSAIHESIFNEIIEFKFSGDWLFYTQLLIGKKIAYCANKLNYHRKHGHTITSKFTADKPALLLLLKEQEMIYDKILQSFAIDQTYLPKWEIHISSQFGTIDPLISKDDYDKIYPYSLLKEKFENAIIHTVRNKRLAFLTTNDYSSNGGSEQLWIETALECRNRGNEVMVIIKKHDPTPYFIDKFNSLGIKVQYKGRDDFRQLLLFRPDLLVVSTGDQDEGIEWYDKCIDHNINYVIVNQLTKEPEYWPIKRDINSEVAKGYLGAASVFFTCKNNHKVMEKRLNCKLPHASIHYNPYHIDKDSFIPFPSMKNGLDIAMPANLSRVHKGQHLALELFNLKKWRERPVRLNLYGEGYDEEVLKTIAKNYGLQNVIFHKHTNDLLKIWRANHAIMLSSFMEGLPIVLVGSMICARVPIVTDIGAHREVIDDNVDGFIARYPTVEALDEALERAYLKSDMWEEMGQKARQKILSLLPENPVDDFISKIMPLTTKQ